jgi:hypothetical protein
MLLIGRQLHCSACYTNSVVMPKDGSSSFEKMIGGHFTLGGHFTHISPTLVKIRNAALQKKRKPNLKIFQNSKCDLLRRDDMNAK